MAGDWYDVKFLESASNVRRVMNKSTGRTPSAAVATEIAVSIQQGRLFFESASNSQIQIRPLLIYYGIISFAQATIMARQGVSIATLARRHGLSDITESDGSLEKLLLKIENRGTFQEFASAIAPLNRMKYFFNSTPTSYENPFDDSSKLANKIISFIDIISRIPTICDKITPTYGIESNAALLQFNFEAFYGNRCTITLYDDALFSGIDDLKHKINKWRSCYPFLAKWEFYEASQAWGKSYLVFDNSSDFANMDLEISDARPIGFVNARRGLAKNFRDVREMLPPLSGGYVQSSATYTMRPLFDVILPEYCLQFLGCFVLSSLVRYRPQIWQHAISRSVTEARAGDDRSLAIIELFLDYVSYSFPQMVVACLQAEAPER